MSRRHEIELLAFLLARLALVPVGLAVVLAVVPALASEPEPAEHQRVSEQPQDRERSVGEQAARLLSRAISIPTVAPADDEAQLARLYVEALHEAGLEALVLPTPDAQAPGLEPGPDARHAAAWGRLQGNGKRPPIILLSHLDVVPAGDPAWLSSPFRGQIEAGYVIGRGALDAKGISVIHLMAMAELARAGVELERDVLFLATPGEETGGELGAAYVIATHPERLGNAEYLLTEGGGILLDPTEAGGGSSVWGVAVAEKSPCWIELVARGAPGHASVPPRDTAIPRLIAALDRVRRIETRVRVLPEVAEMFRALSPTAAPEDRAGYLDLERALADDAPFRRRFLADPGRNALVRDTLSITMLEGSEATNSLPSRAWARIDARLLPGRLCADLERELVGAIRDDHVSLERLLEFTSKTSAADTALFEAIASVAEREDPGAIVAPRVIAGFTDAHYFRAIGITAYGFTPHWLSPEESQGIHGPNERVSIENLERGTRVLVEILRELAGN